MLPTLSTKNNQAEVPRCPPKKLRKNEDVVSRVYLRTAARSRGDPQARNDPRELGCCEVQALQALRTANGRIKTQATLLPQQQRCAAPCS